MKNGQSDFGDRREAIRRERAGIAVEIGRLASQDEQLAREDERLRIEAEQVAAEPFLVNAAWLIAKLGTSKATFSRLVNNPAKGFPAPVTTLSSDRHWIWPEVKNYFLATARNDGCRDADARGGRRAHQPK